MATRKVFTSEGDVEDVGADGYEVPLVMYVKPDTGESASPVEGQIEANATDKTIKVYAGGAWRTLTDDWV